MILFTKKACYLLIGFFYLLYHPASAQDQRIADSLLTIYKADTVKGLAKLNLLKVLSFNETKDSKLALQYAEELIMLSSQNRDDSHLSEGYFQKGNAKRLLGDLDGALAAFIKSAEIAKKENLISVEGSAYGSIGDIYVIANNHKNAMLYYHQAIGILRQSDDSVALASNILNAGDAFLNNKNYDSALLYFRESQIIFENVNYLTGKAYCLGNIGMVYANTGQSNLAEKNINEAIRLLEQTEDYYPICVYLISMSDIYLQKGDNQTAMNYAGRSLKLAQQYGLKEQISDANLKLSDLYDRAGNTGESYKYYKNHIAYRDSINNINSVQKMADLRTDYEVSQKQVEVDLLHQQKKNQQIIVIATVIALVLIFIMAIGLYRRYNFIKATNKIIEKEKSRSDNLLLNILPEETAHELKENGKVLAKKFESVTVLFTDFKGFTQYAENLSPEKLVESVDFYFSKFDEIMGKYNLEKIKTVGDAYMCAGGLPFATEDHAHKMVQAAFEIADFVNESKKIHAANEIRFDIRIGINTGPVVAGVVGSRKFSYDIWGDTVNIASRMESNSEPGKINISANTYELIKDTFDCDYRGEIEVKNRGMMKMYFVNSIKQTTI